MNNNVMTNHKDIFDGAKKFVLTSYLRFSDIFKEGSLEVEDVLSEINMAILETIKKFNNKDKKDINKLCNRAMRWKILDLIRSIISVSAKLKTYKEWKKIEYKEEKYRRTGIKDDFMPKLPAHYQEEKRYNELDIIINFLSTTEKKIIRYYFHDGYTLREIAEVLGKSYEGIRKIKNKAIKKIASYLNVESTQLTRRIKCQEKLRKQQMLLKPVRTIGIPKEQ